MKIKIVAIFLFASTILFAQENDTELKWPREIVENEYTITLYQAQLETLDKNIYDDIYTHIENEEDFINQSEKNMEYVGIDIKYDDKPEYAGEDFINRSQTNWKIVGDK